MDKSYKHVLAYILFHISSTYQFGLAYMQFIVEKINTALFHLDPSVTAVKKKMANLIIQEKERGELCEGEEKKFLLTCQPTYWLNGHLVFTAGGQMRKKGTHTHTKNPLFPIPYYHQHFVAWNFLLVSEVLLNSDCINNLVD